MSSALTFVAVALALLGVLASWASPICFGEHWLKKQDQGPLGLVTWSLIGVVGYATILVALLAGYQSVATTLAEVALAVTLWLMYRAYRLRYLCPACVLVWLVGIVLALLLIGHPLR